MDKKNKLSLRELFREALPGMAVILFGGFMLCFYAPLELYITNQRNFWFSMRDMLPAALILFTAGAAAAILVLLLSRRLGEKCFVWVFGVMLAIFLCAYIQGSYMIRSLPVIDGVHINWGDYPRQRFASVLLWVLVPVGLFVAARRLGARRFARIGAFLSLALLAVLVITLGVLLLTTPEVDKDAQLIHTDKDLFSMSEDENFIVFLLDSMDAEEFDRLLELKENRSVFEDFTYFDNTCSGYPYTFYSIPLILTGQYADPDIQFETFCNDAVKTSPLFNALKQKDYRMGLYCEPELFLTSENFDGQFNNLIHSRHEVTSELFMGKLLMKMTVMKFAPWDLKWWGYDLNNRLDECKVIADHEDIEDFDFMNDVFYRQIQSENPISLTDCKDFKFIHLYGAHVPFLWNKNMERVPEADFYSSMECCITLVDTYIQRLKESGVYDNSVIVVLSDHSYDLDGSKFRRMDPVLLIKGRNETHPFCVSSAPVAHEDLQDAFLKLLDGSVSEDAFVWKEGDSRERRCFIHDTQQMQEYIQNGHARDPESFTPVGKTYNLTDIGWLK